MDRSTTLRGLTEEQRATFRALLPAVLGLGAEEDHLAEQATDRFDGYLKSLPAHEHSWADHVRATIDALRKLASTHAGEKPEELDPRAREELVRDLFEGADERESWTDKASRLFGRRKPSARQVTETIRHAMALALYSNPASEDITQYTPLWKREDVWSRGDVDAKQNPGPQPTRIAPTPLLELHHRGHPYDPAKLFRGDAGRRIAIIGAGSGGGIVAARLAKAGFDVAVFEAGPRLASHEWPLDELSATGLLYERGLRTPGHDRQVHITRARVVGGGSAVSLGACMRLRPATRKKWLGEEQTGLDAEALDAAFEAVRERLHMRELNPELTTEPGDLLKRGADRLEKEANEVLWTFRCPEANVVMYPGQRGDDGADAPRDAVGNYCHGCGLCHHGCRFGHKMSTDRTYLAEAEAAGARIHPNLPIERLTATRDEQGRVRVDGIVLGRGIGEHVPVDGVVLAAGAVGSPAVLLRSLEHDATFEALPPMRGGTDDRAVGNGLGLNYGVGVVARWKKHPRPRGDHGMQLKYVANDKSDGDFVVRTSFFPPGWMADAVPGIGADHRRWMEDYRRMGLSFVTLGSPSKGRVNAKGDALYSLDDGELDALRRALAATAHTYLASGALEVGIAGVRLGGKCGVRFFPDRDGNKGRRELRRMLEGAISDPEQIALSSWEPQGGLRLSEDPERGAVGPDFRVHGAANVFVSDASLLPTTTVVGPQWTIMALATMAADAIVGSFD